MWYFDSQWFPLNPFPDQECKMYPDFFPWISRGFMLQRPEEKFSEFDTYYNRKNLISTQIEF